MRLPRLAAIVFVVACNGRAPGEAGPPVEWPYVGGDEGSTHYSSLDQVNRANVDRLRPAWRWRTVDGDVEVGGGTAHPGAFESTPVMINDTLYFTTAMSRAVALEAETGRQLWVHDPDVSPILTSTETRWGMVHRGVAVWSGDGTRRVFLAAGASLVALEASSGSPVPSFGDNGRVSLTAALKWEADSIAVRSTSAPVVIGDLVIVGSAIPDPLIHDRDPPGALHAFDVRTGVRRWTWHTIPDAGGKGSETWNDGADDRVGHANVWSPMSVDRSRGLVFANVSAASNDWYGGRRKGSNLYSESLVCLDGVTGQLLWHFQYVHHGLWDYESAAPPMLITVEHDGAPLDVVAVPGKTGFLYVLDRETGAPLWPVEERAVPPSDVPGEEAWPTQPFPTWPPPFTQQGMTEDDLVDFTPELRAMALERVRGVRFGPLFQPPSLEGTLVLPGWRGGAGWGGGAWDPGQGRLYVKSTRDPVLARLVPPTKGTIGDNAGYRLENDHSPQRVLDLELPRRHRWQPWKTIQAAIPIIKPPYGQLAAYAFPGGDLTWNVTVGDAPRVRMHPMLRHLDLPSLGTSSVTGPIVTAGGVIFVGGGEALLALDSRTGAHLWQGELKSLSRANPMTYRTRSGRQFIVVGHGEGASGRLTAFALSPGDR